MHIIINDDLAFAVVQTMQAANILLKRAAPRNRHDQEKGVEARIVEAFTDVTASRQQNSFLVIRDAITIQDWSC